MIQPSTTTAADPIEISPTPMSPTAAMTIKDSTIVPSPAVLNVSDPVVQVKPKRLRNAARREHDALVIKQKADAEALAAKQKADAQAAYDALPGCKKRKKSPPPNKTSRKNPNAGVVMKAKMADPVWKAKWRAALQPSFDYRKLHPEKFYRRGVPDGMRKVESDKLWAEARVKAKKVIKAMEDEGSLPVIVIPDSDEDKAKLVLEEMMTIVMSPLSHQPTKIAAGRTVLEWTRSKPVQKTSVNITSAEDWLNSVLIDSKVIDGGPARLEGPET